MRKLLKNIFNPIYMIEILRKPGYTINPNDKIVNGILKGIKKM